MKRERKKRKRLIVTSPHCYPSVASTLLLVIICLIPFINKGTRVNKILLPCSLLSQGATAPANCRGGTLVNPTSCAKVPPIILFVQQVIPPIMLHISLGLRPP